MFIEDIFKVFENCVIDVVSKGKPYEIEFWDTAGMIIVLVKLL